MNRFAQIVNLHTHKLGYNLAELSVWTGISLQQLRKLVQGSELPSRQMVQSISAVLAIDVAELAALAAADYAERKYGVIVANSIQEVELEAVRALWRRLSEAERNIILATMRDFVEQNEREQLYPATPVREALS